jgi:hypothetical protein
MIYNFGFWLFDTANVIMAVPPYKAKPPFPPEELS